MSSSARPACEFTPEAPRKNIVEPPTGEWARPRKWPISCNATPSTKTTPHAVLGSEKSVIQVRELAQPLAVSDVPLKTMSASMIILLSVSQVVKATPDAPLMLSLPPLTRVLDL